MHLHLPVCSRSAPSASVHTLLVFCQPNPTQPTPRYCCRRYADKASMEVGLLFTCRLGDVDLERPVGEWLGVVVWRA